MVLDKFGALAKPCPHRLHLKVSLRYEVKGVEYVIKLIKGLFTLHSYTVFLWHEFSDVEQDLSICQRPVDSDSMLTITAAMMTYKDCQRLNS